MTILARKPWDPLHGNYRRYQKDKCRCPACRAAWTEHTRKQRAMRKARLQADPTLQPHGNINTYYEWGCRCRPCRVVTNAQRRHARTARWAFGREWLNE